MKRCLSSFYTAKSCIVVFEIGRPKVFDEPNFFGHRLLLRQIIYACQKISRATK